MNKMIPIFSLVFSLACLANASTKPPSFVWVLISDPHIMKKGENIARENQLKEAIEEINTLSPDFVIATGDLVEFPSDAAYQNYTSIVSQLDAPLYNVIGNHDDNFTVNPEDYAGLYEKYTKRPSYYSFDWKGYHLIILDSVKPGAHSGSFHIPADQLKWLESDLSKANGKKILIFSHHPPTGKRADVDDYDALRSIMKGHNVKAFYSAHRHGKPLEELIDNIYFVNTGALSFPLGGSKLGYRINAVSGDEMWTAWVRLEDPKPIFNPRHIDESDEWYKDGSGESNVEWKRLY